MPNAQKQMPEEAKKFVDEIRRRVREPGLFRAVIGDDRVERIANGTMGDEEVLHLACAYAEAMGLDDLPSDT